MFDRFANGQVPWSQQTINQNAGMLDTMRPSFSYSLSSFESVGGTVDKAWVQNLCAGHCCNEGSYTREVCIQGVAVTGWLHVGAQVQRVGVARLLLSLASSSSIVRDELEHDADKRKALRRELNDIRIKMRRHAFPAPCVVCLLDALGRLASDACAKDVIGLF